MLLLACAGLFSLLYLARANPVVDLGYVKYRGNNTFPDTVAYLGLPYAEPPVGDLRWRAPLPLNTARVQHQAHGAVIDATSYPNFCIQGSTGSECLITPDIPVTHAIAQVVMLAARVARTV